MFLAFLVPAILFLFAWNLIIPELANGLLNLIISLHQRAVTSLRTRRADSTWVKEGAHIF
jgi:hypothetical protein